MINIHHEADNKYSEIIIDFNNNIIPSNKDIEEFFKYSHSLSVCLTNQTYTPLNNYNPKELKRICDFIHSKGRYIECKTIELINDPNIDCWCFMIDKPSEKLINHIKTINEYDCLVRFEILNSACNTFNKFNQNYQVLIDYYQNYGYQIYVENIYDSYTLIEFLDSYRIYNYNYYVLCNSLITTKRDFINKIKEEN